MQKKNEEIQERYELSMNRISEIKNEQTVPAEFISYFQRTAQFIEQIGKVEVLQSSHALATVYTGTVAETERRAVS